EERLSRDDGRRSAGTGARIARRPRKAPGHGRRRKRNGWPIQECAHRRPALCPLCRTQGEASQQQERQGEPAPALKRLKLRYESAAWRAASIAATSIFCMVIIALK